MRNQQPKTFLMDLYENYIPEMRYDGKVSVDEWQKSAREKLSDLLGLQYMVKCDHDFKITETKETDEYTQVRFTFQSEPGYYVACCIRLRKEQNKTRPMICIQGHSRGMHISLGEPKNAYDENSIKSGDRDFCTSALANGFTPVTIEQRYMGENGGDENGPCCYHFREGKLTALQTLLYGRTAIGERVWDVMNLITVLGEQFGDALDMDGVSVMGNSGGGTTTIYVAAMDERIKFAMPSSSVCTYRDSIINIHHCTCNYVPGIARYFDMAEICGMVAPRKLILVAGKEDPIFPKAGVDKTYEIAKQTYKAAGAEEKLAMVFGEEGHRFYAKPAYEAYDNMK